jgi:uncharacterized membrane protein YfcA
MLSLLAVGIVGVLLGMLGGGGSVLILPILVYMVGIEPVVATSYSLVIVGISASFGAGGYVRKGLVNRQAVIAFGIPSVLGVFLTRLLILPNLPDEIVTLGSFQLTKNVFVMLIFAVMILFSAFAMIRGSSVTEPNLDGSDREATNSVTAMWSNVSVGFLVGALTGFVGAGGGFMIVPALVVFLKLPIRKAIATSLFIISMKSLLGFMGDLFVLDSIQWGLLIRFTIAAVVGIVLGVRLNEKIPTKQLKAAFGWTILVLGIAILIREAVY